MDTPLHAKDLVFDDFTQSGLFPLHANTERFSQTINHVVFDCLFHDAAHAAIPRFDLPVDGRAGGPINDWREW